ncbi:hypothetical protein FZC78_22625 [Rossellomorea vietnamensis]|uniref:Uncharacterized protein n=1 Tax=Rossellomorea vietnamensis TaxID=218284 RepID=A0A5D4NJ59_9BACI|nr:hypothetical protein [Rossellomorea vietnamensis]TYS12982.1 hypothetical protein FZC78_22625 [Rossellomorea vietnamensis]
MAKEKILLRLNAEQLLMRVSRYNSLVHYGAPEVVRASELQMILETLCKAVEATREIPVEETATSHKSFIKKDVVNKWARHNEEFFQHATQETLDNLQFYVNRSLTNRAEEIMEIAEWEKEQELLEKLHDKHGIVSIENYKFKTNMDEMEDI